PYNAYIISDYPHARFSPQQLEHIRHAVAQGAGLLMIGGWESFHGQSGEYHHSLLAEVLPVNMLQEDDRRNFSQWAFILKHAQQHPILNGLPWEKPPFIGGLNQFTAKPDANVLLKAVTVDVRVVNEEKAVDCSNDSIFNYINKPIEERLSVSLPGDDAMFLTLMETFPLLVVGQYGKGRTAALATDVAPHWVGGWVDWGKKRITQKLHNGNSIEVGENYVQFLTQLLHWIGQ
ncbi:MAG: glutamine amidotransferase, partial [Planctomycetaceae bacterium]|nr:glutamine amidotransferase [Planctomycetaceae bacterium]